MQTMKHTHRGFPFFPFLSSVISYRLAYKILLPLFPCLNSTFFLFFCSFKLLIHIIFSWRIAHILLFLFRPLRWFSFHFASSFLRASSFAAAILLSSNPITTRKNPMMMMISSPSPHVCYYYLL